MLTYNAFPWAGWFNKSLVSFLLQYRLSVHMQPLYPSIRNKLSNRVLLIGKRIVQVLWAVCTRHLLHAGSSRLTQGVLFFFKEKGKVKYPLT